MGPKNDDRTWNDEIRVLKLWIGEGKKVAVPIKFKRVIEF